MVSAPLLVQEGYILGIRFDVSGHILAEGVSQEQEKTITISWGVFPGDGATATSGGQQLYLSPASRARRIAWARSATCSLLKMFET